MLAVTFLQTRFTFVSVTGCVPCWCFYRTCHVHMTCLRPDCHLGRWKSWWWKDGWKGSKSQWSLFEIAFQHLWAWHHRTEWWSCILVLAGVVAFPHWLLHSQNLRRKLLHADKKKYSALLGYCWQHNCLTRPFYLPVSGKLKVLFELLCFSLTLQCCCTDVDRTSTSPRCNFCCPTLHDVMWSVSSVHTNKKYYWDQTKHCTWVSNIQKFKS